MRVAKAGVIWPHLLIVITVIGCAFVLALEHDITSDAVLALFGAAIGGGTVAAAGAAGVSKGNGNGS